MPLLEAYDLKVRTVDLPSVARADRFCDLSSDAGAVGAVLDEVRGPILLCGHSYGGMVITMAAAGRSDVKRLVYVCGAMPESGESGAQAFKRAGIVADWINIEDGQMFVNLEQAADLFYGDCDQETQQWATQKLRPMSTAPHFEPVAQAAWRAVPSTYVVCTQDRAISPEAQRRVFAPQADESLELCASHSPFLSRPRELVNLLALRA